MKKKIFSLVIVCLFVLVLSGCGKSKNITCSKNMGLDNDTSSKIILYLDKDKISKIEDHLIFQSPALANEYNNNIKNSNIKTKVEHNSVIMTYEGDNIMNRIAVSDLKKDTIKSALEDQGYTCE